MTVVAAVEVEELLVQEPLEEQTLEAMVGIQRYKAPLKVIL